MGGYMILSLRAANFIRRILFIYIPVFFVLFSLLYSTALSAAKNDSVTYLRNIDEFEFVKQFDDSIGIYVLKSEKNRRFLIKGVYDDGAIISSGGDNMNDFLGSFILRKIIGDRAPMNYMIKLNGEDGEITSASEFIKDFTTVSGYLFQYVFNFLTEPDMDAFVGKDGIIDAGCMPITPFSLPPRCRTDAPVSSKLKKIYLSHEYLETFRLLEFIAGPDHHDDNVGFILQDGKIINSALVDFDDSLLDDGPFISRHKDMQRRYYLGIDDALQSLRLISSFDLNSLDELYPLFDQLGKKEVLEQVKDMMRGQLMDVNRQIEFCEIAKKIIAGDCGIEEFDRVINMDIFTDRLTMRYKDNTHMGMFLDRLTIRYKENILMNVLYERKDLSRITAALHKEPILIATLVRYCLKHNEYGLLNDIALKLGDLSTDLVEETLKQSQTEEHLSLLLKLMGSITPKPDQQPESVGVGSKSYMLVNKFLNDDSFDIKGLYKNFSELLERYNICQNDEKLKYPSGRLNRPDTCKTFYHRLVSKLLVMAVIDPKRDLFDISYDVGIGIIDSLLDNDEDSRDSIKKYSEIIKYDSQLLSGVIGRLVNKGRLNIAVKILEKIKDTSRLDHSEIDSACMESDFCSALPEFKNSLDNALEKRCSLINSHRDFSGFNGTCSMPV